MDMNANKNDGSTIEGKTYEGKKILKVLRAVIGEDQSGYLCVLDDGEKQFIPYDYEFPEDKE